MTKNITNDKNHEFNFITQSYVMQHIPCFDVVGIKWGIMKNVKFSTTNCHFREIKKLQ
jgi:hypothetical protein